MSKKSNSPLCSVQDQVTCAVATYKKSAEQEASITQALDRLPGLSVKPTRSSPNLTAQELGRVQLPNGDRVILRQSSQGLSLSYTNSLGGANHYRVNLERPGIDPTEILWRIQKQFGGEVQLAPKAVISQGEKPIEMDC